jgi:GMP synthase-like glutamine amidotransferase
VPSCLVVQHVAPEGPYGIGEALRAAGVSVESCRVFAGDALPRDLTELDGVVVMGDEGFATRSEEVALLSSALSARLPVLGICLGAQLLALAAGGQVFAGTAGQEIGWHPITLTRASTSDPLLGGLEASFEVLHWHGDTFSLPADAVLLASSERYESQAFRVGASAWGLQFHLEVDEGAVQAFLSAFGAEADAAGISSDALAEASERALGGLGPIRELVANRFAELVVSLAATRSR